MGVPEPSLLGWGMSPGPLHPLGQAVPTSHQQLPAVLVPGR